MVKKTKFPLLFSPVKLGKVEIKNRLIMAAMATEYGNEDGSVNDQIIAYYARRAQGGTGAITVEPAYVDRRGNSMVRHLGFDRDDQIPGYRRLADAIHSNGAKAFQQVYHGGATTRTALTGYRPMAPSMVPPKRNYEIPRSITVEEIHQVARSFGQTARRIKEAGFDGMEIHACHSCLLSQFMSPFYNKRKDAYGGSLEGRVKIVMEVLEQCRKNVGSGFPIIIRINGEERYSAPGNTLADAIKISLILQDMVDAINVSSPESVNLTLADQGKLVPLAAAIKKEVRVPVITAGAIVRPEFAEQILRDGCADIICIGRPLLADPDFANKAAGGKLDDLRQCVLCHMCRQRELRPQVNCMANFETGREGVAALKLTPVKKPKKVIVIGGGPGGMEAARTAALKGHRVTLYEKSRELGGQLRLAAAAPGKSHIGKVADYLAGQIKKAKVEVKLGTTVTRELLEREKPDVAIVATGSSPKRLDCAMVESRNEMPNVVTAHDVLAGTAGVGTFVLVVGAGAVGAETAELLSEQGKGVTLIDQLPVIAGDLEDSWRQILLQHLNRNNVVVYPSTKLKKVIGKDVVLDRDVPMYDPTVDSKEQLLVGVDTIVFSVGSAPNKGIAEEIRGIVPEVYIIGDARSARTAMDAIHEGSRIGRTI